MSLTFVTLAQSQCWWTHLPGNLDSLDYLITTADTIMDSEISLIRGIPGVMNIGGQEVPTYDLTVRVSTQRS